MTKNTRFKGFFIEGASVLTEALSRMFAGKLREHIHNDIDKICMRLISIR